MTEREHPMRAEASDPEAKLTPEARRFRNELSPAERARLDRNLTREAKETEAVRRTREEAPEEPANRIRETPADTLADDILRIVRIDPSTTEGQRERPIVRGLIREYGRAPVQTAFTAARDAMDDGRKVGKPIAYAEAVLRRSVDRSRGETPIDRQPDEPAAVDASEDPRWAHIDERIFTSPEFRSLNKCCQMTFIAFLMHWFPSSNESFPGMENLLRLLPYQESSISHAIKTLLGVGLMRQKERACKGRRAVFAIAASPEQIEEFGEANGCFQKASNREVMDA